MSGLSKVLDYQSSPNKYFISNPQSELDEMGIVINGMGTSSDFVRTYLMEHLSSDFDSRTVITPVFGEEAEKFVIDRKHIKITNYSPKNINPSRR